MKKQTQLEILRKLSGKKRLEIAFRLSSIVRELAMANVKMENPRARKKKLTELLKKRLSYG